MYPGINLDGLGQIYHFNIQVLGQTDFLKAVDELNLDLSAYNCVHAK